LAHLIFVDFGKGDLGSFKADQNAIYEYLTERKVYAEAVSFYKGVHMLRVGIDRLENQDWDHIKQIEEEIKGICLEEPQKSEDLLRGPILKWYLERIKDTLNSGRGLIEIENCMQVDVSDGYVAFTKASDVYKYRIEKEMREEGVPNLKEVLEIAREEAVTEYRKHSDDAEYIVYLGDFIDVKERRLTEENTRIYELQNLTYLQTEAELLIDRVNRQKMDQAAANREIELFVENYEKTQQGDTRFHLLSECLKYLNPTVTKYSWHYIEL
jgi:hypothetical protein